MSERIFLCRENGNGTWTQLLASTITTTAHSFKKSTYLAKNQGGYTIAMVEPVQGLVLFYMGGMQLLNQYLLFPFLGFPSSNFDQTTYLLLR